MQVAHPLNRDRLQREAAMEVGLDPEDPDAPPKIDKWRYYFGLGFFPSDLLSAGERLTQTRLFD